MKSSKNIIKNIKSKYCVNIIFNYIDRKSKLKIIKFNKHLRALLNIGEHCYLFNKIYNQLDTGKLKELYYNNSTYNNENKNELSILNLLENNIKNKKRHKKLLIDFFKDLYDNYYRALFIIYYNSKYFSKENFNDLLSLNSPIKIYVKINLTYFFLLDELNNNEPEKKMTNPIIKAIQNILTIFDYYKYIYGFDFVINEIDEIYYEIDYNSLPEQILNKLNRIFPKIEYICIPCEIISDLIDNKKILFFKNKPTKIQIYDYSENGLYNFMILLENKESKIQEFLKVDKLIIDLYNPDREDNFNELDLSGIEGIKNLELNHFYYNNFILDEIAINSIKKLTLFNVSIIFKQNYIKFPNLISLNLKETYLLNIFSGKFFEPNSFFNLEQITIDIVTNIDFILFNNLLKSTNHLKDLNIRCNGDYNESQQESEYNVYFDYYNDDSLEKNWDNYNKAFDEISKNLANTICNLKSLKTLRINDFNFQFTYFKEKIFENFHSDNLIEFESNCIQSSYTSTFLKNNKNLKIIKMENKY